LVLLRLADRLVGAAPRAASEPVCALAGLVAYAAAPDLRAAVRDNLSHVLGRPPTPRQVWRVFQHGAFNYWDTLALPHLSRAQLLDLVHIDGWQHLDAARAGGKGVLLVSAHLSSAALAGQVMAARGYPMLGLVEAVQSPEMLDFFTRHRARFGTRIIPAGPSAVRPLLTALRANEVVGIVSDRDITGTGLPVRFFDAVTTFPDGPATFSLRTGSPVLPAVAVRTSGGRFRGVIGPPIHAERTGDIKRDVHLLTQAVARTLEYHIGQFPEQWTVYQRRWPSAAGALPRPAS
jgi:KDO2-lipid IV(A) lauroyltransferase